MNIKWNEVTWYSKLGALILFLLVVPCLTFYIGMQYQLLKNIDQSIVYLPSPVTPTALAQSMSHGTSSDAVALRRELIRWEVQYSILDIWGMRGIVMTSPLYPDRYFYARSDDRDMLSIDYYDSNLDRQSDVDAGSLNFGLAKTAYRLDKKMAPANTFQSPEFRLVGFDGPKLVFMITDDADTPGPCSNPWIRTGKIVYEYLDVTAIQEGDTAARPYVLSDAMKKQYQAEEASCVKSMQ